MKLLIVISLVILLFGCTDYQQMYRECSVTLSGIEVPECGVCQDCVCEYEPRIEYKEKIIYINTSLNKEKADWYILLAKKEAKGYYKDYLEKKYDACEDKLERPIDYVSIGIGLYGISNDTGLVEAYKDYLRAISIIYSYCSDYEDGADLDGQAILDYRKWYERYKLHIWAVDTEIPLFEK